MRPTSAPPSIRVEPAAGAVRASDSPIPRVPSMARLYQAGRGAGNRPDEAPSVSRRRATVRRARGEEGRRGGWPSPGVTGREAGGRASAGRAGAASRRLTGAGTAGGRAGAKDRSGNGLGAARDAARRGGGKERPADVVDAMDP